MTNVGLLLHGADTGLRDRLVGALARAEGYGEVRAVEQAAADGELEPACRRLVEVCDVVLGVPAWPWPGWAAAHDAARDLLPDLPYWAVETWHGLPDLAAVLAEHVEAVAPADARVLLTAPDHAVVGLPAEQRAFLRELAEGLHAAMPQHLPRPTVAVDRSPAEGAVTPTATGTLATLVEAHGATAVVRASMVPGDGPDPDMTAVAAAQGVQLHEAAPSDDDHVVLLLAAVAALLPPALEDAAARAAGLVDGPDDTGADDTGAGPTGDAQGSAGAGGGGTTS